MKQYNQPSMLIRSNYKQQVIAIVISNSCNCFTHYSPFPNFFHSFNQHGKSRLGTH
uniref:Uncharacterized protein n=1 Tax=Arundo donax TaxID=35708 RepID=A0A0A9B7I3_ARUDO